jgi:hypothetical protein
MKISYIIVLILMTYLHFSCKEFRLKKEVKKVVTSYIDKEIIVPDTMIYYCNSGKISKHFISEDKMKIFVYIDGDCSKCVESLIEWQQFIENNNNTLCNCLIVFFITSSNFNLIEKLLNEIKFKYSVVFDYKNAYLLKNNFNNPILNTVLVDSQNRIILVGNPLGNLKLTDLYLNKINKLIKAK